MDIVVLAARVLLALVFGVAGVAKLADRAGSQQVLRDFGLPGWLARLVGVLLKLDALEAKVDAGTPAPVAAAAAPVAPGLPVGSAAPDFSLPGLYGETLTLGALRAAGQPVVLVFLDPDCGPCNALLPEVGRWQREQAGQLTLAVISRGTPEANLRKSAEHGISRVLLQQDREAAERDEAYGTPSAVV